MSDKKRRGLWRVSVAIPLSDEEVAVAEKDRLFTAICDAAFDWEPAERDGWDVEVSGGPVVWPERDDREARIREQIVETVEGIPLGPIAGGNHDYIDVAAAVVETVVGIVRGGRR